MKNNYDRIAQYYDRLSRAVFGNAQVNAQINQLQFLPQNGNILIVGGGTGWILKEISKVNPTGLNITYVEVSASMMQLSKQKNAGKNHIVYHQSSIEEFESNIEYDVVLTPFLFDNFSEDTCVRVFQQLDSFLKAGGLWLMADFSTNKGITWWKTAFLWLMYRFFSIVSNVETTKLFDMSGCFQKFNYLIVDERFYFGRFIKATVYKKSRNYI